MKENMGNDDGLSSPLINIAGLSIEFAGKACLRDVNMTVPRGKITCLVGQTGSGKSLLVRTMMGLLGLGKGDLPNLLTGSIHLHLGTGELPILENESKSPQETIRRMWWTLRKKYILGKAVAMVFQDAHAHIHPDLPASTQISENFNLDEDEIDQILSLVRLDQRLSGECKFSSPGHLSGGEKQRLLIAGALAIGLHRMKSENQKVDLLVVDEPFTDVDNANQAFIEQVLFGIDNGFEGIESSAYNQFFESAVLVSHDIDLVKRVADVIYVMKKGEVVQKLELPDLQHAVVGELRRDSWDMTLGTPGFYIDPYFENMLASECVLRSRYSGSIDTHEEERISSMGGTIDRFTPPNQQPAEPSHVSRRNGSCLDEDDIVKSIVNWCSFDGKFGLSGSNNGNTPCLEAEDISVKFKSKREEWFAIDKVGFRMPPRGIIGIIGSSGSGKTTLANVLAGLHTPDRDSQVMYVGSHVCLNIVELSKGGLWRRLTLGRGDLLRERLQLVFQESKCGWGHTINSSLWDIYQRTSLRKRISRSEFRDRMLYIMDSLDIPFENYSAVNPVHLSGGELRRLCLVRALLALDDQTEDSKVLILDEATRGLDLATLQQTLHLLLNYLRDMHKITCLFITHDLDALSYVADLVMVMHNGRLVQVVDPSYLFDNKKYAQNKNKLHPETRRLIDRQLHGDSGCESCDSFSQCLRNAQKQANPLLVQEDFTRLCRFQGSAQ